MKDILDSLSGIGVSRHYKKGNIIFYEGEYAKYFFILKSGIVRVYKSISHTRELTINRFYPLSFIAEMPAFKDIAYPASAICEEDCEILEINFLDFKDLCLKDNNFSFLMISSLFEKIGILERGLLQNSMELRSRLIHFLLENENDLSRISQRKIAFMLNVRAESLSRILKEFREKNFISTNKGKIEILNKDALQDEIW